MLPEDHLRKAGRLKRTCLKLSPENDWETVVESCFGMALHLISFLCMEKSGKHLDTHKGLSAFLVGIGLREVSELFRELDSMRIGRWYGGKENGKSARRALAIIAELERMVGERKAAKGDEE